MTCQFRISLSSSSSSSLTTPSEQLLKSFRCLLIMLLSFCFWFLASESRKLSNTPTSSIGGADDSRALLLAFKQTSIHADPNNFLADWSSNSSDPNNFLEDPCSWRGISCSIDGLITALNLTDAGLIGRLSISELVQFPTLTHLHLGGNSFSGNLSSTATSSCSFQVLDLSRNQISDLRIMSYALSNCRSLNLLNISSNLLSGELPSNFTIAESLKFLDLSHNNFTGKFTSFEFGTCPNLTELNLSHNGLSGQDFPATLSNCRSLETLDLGSNDLNCEMPGVLLGNFKKLRRLSLSHNQFSGKIPPDLGHSCGTLEELDLSGNQLVGGLPLNFRFCSLLSSLNLGNNMLSGDFLRTVVSFLTNLRYFYVPFNNITGQLPESLTNCTSLQVLDLSSNSLTGNVPTGFCSSSSSSAMEKLLLANNFLFGEVPSELGDCKNLKTIDLSFNNITGPIPLKVWNLPQLSDVVMWANNITGNIPEGFCINGGNLQTLILNNNRITGKIPLSIVNCSNLIWVSLSSNRITGEIPAGIGNLANLAILQLGNNSLTGRIPPELGKCKNLIWLDLNSNALTGHIPSELTGGAGLVLPGPVSGKQFAFVRNEGGTACRGAGGLVEFEGIRPERLEQFPMIHSCPSTRIYSGVTVYTFKSNGSMMYLDLSYNSLTGTIPSSFGSMNFLQVLNLGHNNLTGNIPSSFGGLKAAGVLDLSHNNLQGFIPGSLGALSFLSDLDFSNNNLSGIIPSGGQLTTFPASRYENNSGLCGVPLSPCGSGNPHASDFNSRGKKKKKKQSMAVGAIIGITFSLLSVLTLTFALYRMNNYRKGEEKEDNYIESLPTSGSSSWKFSGVPEPLSINIATFEKPLRKLTFAHLLEATNGFSAESLIGSGGFGDVYKAQLKDGCVVAVKKLIHVTGQGDREFMAEMETIGKIKHRNLVSLLGYCKIGEERLLVYEYMKWGSLESVLHERRTKEGAIKLDWEARKRICIGAARGVAFLHHSCVPHIIHRDMKSSNVLLDENFEARVSDFGMARLVNALDTHLSVSTLAGTPGYVPPEYFQSFRCTTKGDVYSYGVVLLELISGKRTLEPLVFGDENNLVGWAKQLQKEKRIHEILDPELLVHESVEAELYRYLKIAFKCLEDKPFLRPTMIQVMTMFREIQEDSGSDILEDMAMPNSVDEESQETDLH